MNDFFKKIKLNSLVNAFLYAALGIVLLIWPVASVSVLCWALGAVLLAAGAIDVLLFLLRRDGTVYNAALLVVGVILAALGAWIITGPQLVAGLIPRIIGILICIHGLLDLGDAITLQHNHYPRWGTALALGIITLALGAVLVANPFQVLSTMVRIIGLFLLYDGVSDLWITSRVSKTVRQAQKDTEAQAHAVDVDYTDEKGPEA